MHQLTGRRLRFALLLAVCTPLPGLTTLHAQRLPSASATTALDVWIVAHYHGAQLYPDSGSPTRATGAIRALPYVESVSAAQTTDTLFAVEFSATRNAPTLAVGTKVRLTSPSGVVSTTAADVVVRRAFRAPRVPNAKLNEASDYRYGWSYLLLMRQSATTAASVYRGWLLTDISGAPSSKRSN